MTIKESLDELKELANKLNEESDLLSEFLEGIDDELRKHKIGLSVWLSGLLLEEHDPPLSSPPPPPGKEDVQGLQLGYQKIGDLWRLVVRRVWRRVDLETRAVEQTGRLEVAMPLLNAPRLVRVEAALRLPDLLRAIAEEMRERVDGVVAARKSVELILKSYQTS